MEELQTEIPKPAPPPPPPTFETLEQIAAKFHTAPPIRKIWSGISEGAFGFIYGPPKSGKTTISEALGMCIAGGHTEFLRSPIDVTGQKVLFVSLEEFWQPRTERNIRQQNHMNKQLNCNTNSNYMVVNDLFPRMIMGKRWNILEEAIIASQAKIVFIDSLSRLYDGAIEDSKLAKQVAQHLREFTNRLKITLIIIHHTPKMENKPITINSLAGSRVLGQEADFLIGINRTIDGTRYIKEVAFRYHPENVDQVLKFTINEDSWPVSNTKIDELKLIFNTPDGRESTENLNLVLEFIEEKCTDPSITVSIDELRVEFIEPKVMPQSTLYDQLTKLKKAKLIETVGKGAYKIIPNSDSGI